MKNKSAEYWIDRLNLKPHPEGGYFSEVYRANEFISKQHLPERYSGDRCFSTSIYFLLKGNQASKLHRINSDEIWHFYFGSPITIHIISENGGYKKIKMGQDLESGHVLQYLIKRGQWFGAIVDNPTEYALVGCTVAPGFEYVDFELADKNEMLEKYTEFIDIIEMLT